MTEADLTKRLTAALRATLPGSVVFKHWDHLTVMPDVSVTWGGHTTWIEVKLVPSARTSINARGAQTIMMNRLHGAGSAIYVIYVANPAKIVIISPDQVENWNLSDRLNAYFSEGHNPGFVAEYIRHTHMRRG